MNESNNQSNYHPTRERIRNTNSTQAESHNRSQNRNGGERRYTSESLFGAAKELIIIHAEENYRLRITRNQKLILTK